MGGPRGGSAAGIWTRRALLQRAIVVSAGIASGTFTRGLLASPLSQWARVLQPAEATQMVPVMLDVTMPPYRARGDGIADDRPAIQAAIDDAAAAGGGTVYLPAGEYLLDSVQEQTGVRYYLLNYYSGITLLGAGRDQTILRAGAGMPDQTRVVSAASADGTRRVVAAHFKDFTIDGAAAGQLDAKSMVGLSNVWTEQISVQGVRIRDIAGSEGAEGVCFDSYFSNGHRYVDCEAIQQASLPTGGGFGATHSQSILYASCSASGSGHWMGFSSFKSEAVDYQSCHGFKNAQRGLNCESSKAVRYVNCTAGGRGLGNQGDGIYLFQSDSVHLFDCAASDNQSGVVNNGSTGIRVVRGQFSANARAGISFVTQADWVNSQLEEDPVIEGNGLASIAVAGLPAF